MPRFKVGDKAKVVYIRSRGNVGWYPGVVVEIVSNDGGVDYSGDTFDYMVECSTGILAFPLDEQLEPIVDLGSWGELEKSIGWNPSKQKEIM